jgi:hypothetical protein
MANMLTSLIVLALLEFLGSSLPYRFFHLCVSLWNDSISNMRHRFIIQGDLDIKVIFQVLNCSIGIERRQIGFLEFFCILYFETCLLKPLESASSILKCCRNAHFYLLVGKHVQQAIHHTRATHRGKLNFLKL